MDQPARILIVIDNLFLGGAELIAVQAACGLDKGRFAPHILVTRRTGPLEALLNREKVPFTILGRKRRLSPKAYRKAQQLAFRAALIHTHKFGSNVWGALLSRRVRVPLVVHEHNFSRDPSPLRSLCHKAWIAPAASRVLCVSPSVAQSAVSQGFDEDQVQIVPNGIQLDAAWPQSAARQELGLDDADFVVGITAVLRPEKSHEILLRAVARLAAEGRDVRLCIVGGGPRLRELREISAGLGIEGRTTWTGERTDAARLVAAFDVSVICSAWEGLPLAALESLAAGVPLVATSVGALSTLFGDVTSSLVAPGDVAALAAAIAAVMDSPEQASERAHRGRQLVREKYSSGEMVRQLEAVYDEVLGRSPGGRDRRGSSGTRDGLVAAERAISPSA